MDLLEGFLGANVMLASENKSMKKYLKEILKIISPGGGIGRHKGLKIPR